MSVTKFCDPLENGMPVCLAASFYFDEEPDDEEEFNVITNEEFVRCPHCVISDTLHPKTKNGCFFADDKCLKSTVKGFDACFSCSRWQKVKQ